MEYYMYNIFSTLFILNEVCAFICFVSWNSRNVNLSNGNKWIKISILIALNLGGALLYVICAITIPPTHRLIIDIFNKNENNKTVARNIWFV